MGVGKGPLSPERARLPTCLCLAHSGLSFCPKQMRQISPLRAVWYARQRPDLPSVCLAPGILHIHGS